ncbi:MAG: hypothetical protein MK213_09395 [Planctomycetes bacterium]|nr:hypothetical protein [Planctomycetota bacterium]
MRQNISSILLPFILLASAIGITKGNLFSTPRNFSTGSTTWSMEEFQDKWSSSFVCKYPDHSAQTVLEISGLGPNKRLLFDFSSLTFVAPDSSRKRLTFDLGLLKPTGQVIGLTSFSTVFDGAGPTLNVTKNLGEKSGVLLSDGDSIVIKRGWNQPDEIHGILSGTILD